MPLSKDITDLMQQNESLRNNIQATVLQKGLQDIVNAVESLETNGIDIDNIDKIKTYLREELSSLVPRLREAFKSAIDNVSYEVKMPSDIQFKSPAGFERSISSLTDAIGKFNEKDLTPQVTYNPPDVVVPEIKVPDIQVPQPKVIVEQSKVDIGALISALDEVRTALEPLQLLSDKPRKPISVRMSDGAAWVKALRQFSEGQKQAIQVLANTSGGMTLDEFKTVGGVPKTISHAKVTVAASGTPVNVSTTSIACCKVWLSADIDAGIVLCIGGDNTVRATTGNKNGIILIPGNDPVCIETNDLKNLWVDAAGNGGVLCVTYAAL